MPYVEGRTVHDADAHVVETPDFFFPFADPAIRPRLAPLYVSTVKPGEEHFIDVLRRRHKDPEYRAREQEEILVRKNWSATGSFLKEDRPRALDLLGFSSQLVFNTFSNQSLQRAEHGEDLDLAYGLARAHNRAMIDFCSIDRRLLPTCYVPLADFGLEPGDSYQVHDLITGARFLWHGQTNFVSLDPNVTPAHVLRLRRKARTERDFDYFM